MSPEFLILRVVHVLGAIVWAGTSVFVAFFLSPAIGMAGPPGGAVMGALVKRKLFTIIPIVAVVMMLAGLRLIMILSGGFSAAWFGTRSGQTYVVGAVGALAAFALFMLVSHPAIGRSMKLSQQIAQAPEAERGALTAELNAVRTRAGKASMTSALILMLTAVAMSIGRYV